MKFWYVLVEPVDKSTETDQFKLNKKDLMRHAGSCLCSSEY